MAKSKSKNAPKGIDDQIIGGIRAIMSPWLGTPPAQNNKVTQAQGLARTAAQTLDQTFAGGMIGAGVKGNKALAQQAAVNAAGVGAGYVAGKAIQKTAQVITSGIRSGEYVDPSAALKNFVQGNKIIMHASSTKGLPLLEPRTGSITMPNDNVLFGWDPRARRRDSYVDNTMLNYTNRKNPTKGGQRMAGFQPGSVYVASVPKKNVGPVVTNKKVPSIERMIVSTSPAKIISEIPAPLHNPDQYDPNLVSDYANFRDELGRALRKAGVQPKQVPINKSKRR